MEYLFRVLLMLFSCLLSRGKEIRMVNIVERIKASCIKIVRLVLERGWIWLWAGDMSYQRSLWNILPFKKVLHMEHQSREPVFLFNICCTCCVESGQACEDGSNPDLLSSGVESCLLLHMELSFCFNSVFTPFCFAFYFLFKLEVFLSILFHLKIRIMFMN